jgi:hypothetical protein
LSVISPFCLIARQGENCLDALHIYIRLAKNEREMHGDPYLSTGTIVWTTPIVSRLLNGLHLRPSDILTTSVYD